MFGCARSPDKRLEERGGQDPYVHGETRLADRVPPSCQVQENQQEHHDQHDGHTGRGHQETGRCKAEGDQTEKGISEHYKVKTFNLYHSKSKLMAERASHAICCITH